MSEVCGIDIYGVCIYRVYDPSLLTPEGLAVARVSQLIPIIPYITYNNYPI
jgi:hypothetical protein